MGLDTTTYDVLPIFLTVLYSLQAVFSCVQICRIIYWGHSVRSFQFSFLIIVFAWSLLRLVFFAETDQWSIPLILAMYWFPVDLQFATFSLLVVFYAHLLYAAREWHSKRKIILAIYGLANSTMVALTTTYIALGCGSSTECPVTTGLDRAHHFFMAFQVLVLVIIYAYYSMKLLYAMRSDISFNFGSPQEVQTATALYQSTSPEPMHQQWPSNTSLTDELLHSHGISSGAVGSVGVDSSLLRKSKATESHERLVLLTIGTWFIFLSRCVYNFLEAFDVYSITIGNDNGGKKEISILAFLLFLLWEIVPTVSVLYYFRHIPETEVPRGWPCCPRQSDDIEAQGHEEPSEPFTDSPSSTMRQTFQYGTGAMSPASFSDGDNLSDALNNSVFDESSIFKDKPETDSSDDDRSGLRLSRSSSRPNRKTVSKSSRASQGERLRRERLAKGHHQRHDSGDWMPKE